MVLLRPQCKCQRKHTVDASRLLPALKRRGKDPGTDYLR